MMPADPLDPVAHGATLTIDLDAVVKELAAYVMPKMFDDRTESRERID